MVAHRWLHFKLTRCPSVKKLLGEILYKMPWMRQNIWLLNTSSCPLISQGWLQKPNIGTAGFLASIYFYSTILFVPRVSACIIIIIYSFQVCLASMKVVLSINQFSGPHKHPIIHKYNAIRKGITKFNICKLCSDRSW